MTPFQQRKYWWEWDRARDKFLGQGMTHGAADAQRKGLHVRALGQEKSSKDFTNADLDRVIAVFRGVWDDANFNAQMRQLEQPEQRIASLRSDIERLASECEIKNAIAGLESYLRNWFRGRSYSKLSERELQQLAGILRRRKKKLEASAPAQPAENENPF